MLRNITTTLSLSSFRSGLFVLAAMFALMSFSIGANVQAQHKTHSTKTDAAAAQTNDPVFRQYRGVSIGMTAAEVSQKLGEPKEKSDTQDFYVFSETEIAQFYYDATQKVRAISVDFMSGGNGAPTGKDVVGTDIEAGANGGLYKLVRYPKAGYWVSYSRTAGESPTITITMQKIE